MKYLQIFFKSAKKEPEAPISEEITITHTVNYYNDSLENDPNYGAEENEEEENEKEEEEKGEEEIIEIKKKVIEPNKKGNPEEKEVKEDDKKDKEKDEEKAIKVIYKNENDLNDDKTSSCHIIFHKGADVDINTKKIYECYECTSNRNFLLFKKNVKIKTLIFIEEQYLYLLKDINVNKNNENIRRICNRFDLNRLFDYKIQKKENTYLFTFEFLKDDNLFDKNIKNLLFEEKEGELFEEYLVDVLEKIDATFLDEIFEQNDDDDEEEEEEEDEKKEEKSGENEEEKEKNQINDDNVKNEDNDKKEKKNNFKKIYLEGKDQNLKLSSSREILE